MEDVLFECVLFQLHCRSCLMNDPSYLETSLEVNFCRPVEARKLSEHVEDHHLYSLNYMYFGAPKMWYGLAGADALKLEAAMRKHLPDLFEEQPDLLHKLEQQHEAEPFMGSGRFARAYLLGYNCCDEQELEDALRFC